MHRECSESPLTGTCVWSVRPDEPTRCRFCGRLAPLDEAARAEEMAADLEKYGRGPKRGRTHDQEFAAISKKTRKR